MKNKVLNYYTKNILLAFAFLGMGKMALAQHSIFGKDTVVFNYYRTARDPIKNLTRVNVVNDVVNWIEIFDGIRQSNDSNDINYLKEIFPATDENAERLTVTFRVVKNGHSFSYVSNTDSSKVLFKASLDNKDTIQKVPFFCYPTAISNRIDTSLHFELVYNNDTTIEIKDRMIPCHRFARSFNNFGASFDRFVIRYTEVFFENESCLPVYFTDRVCQAMVIDAEDENSLQPKMMFYLRRFIKLE